MVEQIQKSTIQARAISAEHFGRDKGVVSPSKSLEERRDPRRGLGRAWDGESLSSEDEVVLRLMTIQKLARRHCNPNSAIERSIFSCISVIR